MSAKQPSSTKRGPGRFHVNGTKKAPKPRANRGAWLGQHTNPAKNAIRQAKAASSPRQYRNAVKAARRIAAAQEAA